MPRVKTTQKVIFPATNGSCIDITDLKSRQEEDLARQKLETVGTLAEGIVHDFNNLLGGILANSELALTSLFQNLSSPWKKPQRIGIWASQALARARS